MVKPNMGISAISLIRECKRRSLMFLIDYAYIIASIYARVYVTTNGAVTGRTVDSSALIPVERK